MREQYVVALAHLVRNAVKHSDQYTAAEDAALMVEKDRTPRVVLRVMSEVTVSQTPRVDIVHIAELGCEQ